MELLCKLNQLMIDRGLSQSELIKKSGLTARTLRELRNSTFDQIDKRTIIKLMQSLDLHKLTDLFDIEEQ